MNDKVKRFVKELIPYVIILVVVILIRSYIITPVMVSGTSMSPTLKGREVMILNKMDKKFTRFEIVVVKTDHDDIIKRVIGLPGETISCENNTVYINGRKLEDEFGSGYTSDFKKVKLGKNEYFVMGDNRENSLDSRYYGPFKKSEIKGSTKLVIFPFSRMGNVK